jgi:hypothetical protein
MPVMPMIFPLEHGDPLVSRSVVIFEPVAMNRFRLRHFELLAA